MDTPWTAGPQGIGGYGGHQRRVDPPGEADHDVGEAVFVHVVAGPDDECRIYLLLVTQRLGPRGADVRGGRQLAGAGAHDHLGQGRRRRPRGSRSRLR